jgi:hypothetical protein
MTSTKKNMRKKMMAAMAAAYQEHLDEVVQDPSSREETWDDFFSPYGPAPDDDALLDYFNRRGPSVA